MTVQNRFEEFKPSTLTPAEKQSLIKLATAVLAGRHRGRRTLSSPDDTQTYLRLKLADQKAEVFGAIFLTNRHQVIRCEELFHGTIDGASVYPRVVVQRALELNAAAVLLFHTHPSGVAEPSDADQCITRRLKEALSLIDVRVLDHFIVCAGESMSFAERGIL